MTSYAARLYGTYCCQIISIHVAGAVWRAIVSSMFYKNIVP
jgi:hypothetical protein